MCTWQSQAPAGTSNATFVAGCAPLANTVSVRLKRPATPAITAEMSTSRRVTMDSLLQGFGSALYRFSLSSNGEIAMLRPTKFSATASLTEVSMQQRLIRGILLAVFCVLFLPAVSSAQSAIVGLITDDSGAVLPGVTVEAMSPALIEGTKTAETDGQGQIGRAHV